jgi:signal transduction histidine kinase
MLAALALGVAMLAPAWGAEPVLRVDRALFVQEGEPAVAVDLMHLWTAPATPARVNATYRFELGAAPAEQLQAVFVAGTNLLFVARWNGQTVHSTLLDRRTTVRLGTWRAQPNFHLPPELTRPSGNVLELDVQVPARATAVLGTLQFGSHDAIDRIATRNWIVHNGAPMVIGAMLIAVGLGALGMVRSRHDGELFLLLSAGSMLWGVQTILGQVAVPLLPPPHYSVLILSMYAWFPTLIAVFFMRFAYRRIAAFEYVAAAVAVAAAPLLYLGIYFERSELASIVMRASVLGVISVALVAVLRYALRARTFQGAILLGIGATCVFSAMRDFVVSLTSREVQPVYLTTYSGALLILFAAWMLVGRYHRAYASYEELTRELDARVQQVSGELRQRLAEVQAARELAEEASQAKSRFFAAASHDLRQPLHSLGLFAAALGPHVADQEGRQLVRHVGESIEALKRLFEELLDLSRLDAGHVRVELGDVALQDIFDRLSVEFHAEAVSRELRLRFAPTRLAVHSDAALLHRILANLVANALRYTHAGGVLVGARRRGGRAWIEVYDTGIGIVADEQARIFDELYQVDNPGRDRRQGLGLGLAIVRRIAYRLQHTVTVRSEPDRGSCFRVELPLATSPLRKPLAVAEPLAPVSLPVRRVLVVDDDTVVQSGTSALLREWGLDVATASGLETAQLQIDSGFMPEAALVDLRLGAAHDGVELVQLLRTRLGFPLPAVIVSGDTGEAEANRVRASGLPFLSKPVSPAQLRSALLASLLRPAPS